MVQHWKKELLMHQQYMIIVKQHLEQVIHHQMLHLQNQDYVQLEMQ